MDLRFCTIVLFAFTVLNQSCTKTPDLSEEQSDGNENITFAKPPSGGTTTSILQWQKCFGSTSSDESRAFVKTSDGGYIIGANTLGSNNGDVTTAGQGGYDAWLVKLHSDGSIAWAKTFGTPAYDWILAVAETTDGYVIAGTSYKTPGSTDGDGWIIKTDFSGIIQKEKRVGGTDYEAFTSLVVDAAGNIIAVGQTRSTDSDLILKGGYDVLLLKLDPNFNVLSSRAYGGSLNDVGQSVVIDGSSYVIASTSESNDGDFAGGSKGGKDVRLFRVNLNGDLIAGSQKVYGGSGADEYPILLSHPSGGFILTVTTASTDQDISGHKGGRDAWVARLDADLNLNGSGKCFGGAADDAFRAGTVWDNEIVLTGFSYSKTGDLSTNKGSGDLWVLKLDNSLTKLNSSSFGGRGLEIGWGVAPTSDGYFIAGRTDANGGDVSGLKGGIDVWLLNLKYPN